MRDFHFYDKIEKMEEISMAKQRNEISAIYLDFHNNFLPTDEAFEAELAQVSWRSEEDSVWLGICWTSIVFDNDRNPVDLMRRIEKLYSYAHMKNDQDTVWLSIKNIRLREDFFYSEFQ